MVQPSSSISQPLITPEMRYRNILVANEGFRPTVYRDTEGKRTVGHGFNIDDRAIAKLLPADVVSGKRPISQEESLAIMERNLIPLAMNTARNYVGADVYETLSPNQKAALVDMAYNIGGPKLSGFKETRKAIRSRDYKRASAEIMNSLYATQVPNRAKRNSTLMLQGGL